MPFVKGVGARLGGGGRKGEKGARGGREQEEGRSDGLSCKGARISLASILAAREKKTKTLTPSITIAITRLSQPEKKNQ